jgi:hypothetical protein
MGDPLGKYLPSPEKPKSQKSILHPVNNTKCMKNINDGKSVYSAKEN